ncbi:hypothetical protein AAF712_011982 [Marasmius tenuissimus]|uniref:Uncharacterized protein n=1 Tax=Marasmius tenuissimus TaxID=585030 RepID=A0ABR2ZIM9_9AGAR
MTTSEPQYEKHRGASGWFPPMQRDFLFALSRTDEFKDAVAQYKRNKKPFKDLVSKYTESFQDRFTVELSKFQAEQEVLAKAAKEIAARERAERDKRIIEGDTEGDQVNGIGSTTTDQKVKKEQVYPEGYLLKIQEFFKNRRNTIEGKERSKVEAAVRMDVPLPRTPQKVFRDSMRDSVNAEAHSQREANDIPREEHIGLFNRLMAERYRMASPERRQLCEKISQEEKERYLNNDGAIYVAQEKVQGHLAQVANSLIGKEPGQVGNMWFHGFGAYRDKEEKLVFFSVDAAGSHDLGYGDTIVRQPFYQEFMKHVREWAPARVPFNRTGSSDRLGLPVLREFDVEQVTVSQQRAMLSDHIGTHWRQTYNDDSPVPWSKITSNPASYLIVPPTTFTWADPCVMPSRELHTALSYFWQHPILFKVLNAPSSSGRQSPRGEKTSGPEETVPVIG